MGVFAEATKTSPSRDHNPGMYKLERGKWILSVFLCVYSLVALLTRELLALRESAFERIETKPFATSLTFSYV